MSQKDSDPLVGSLVAERFRIIRRIGGGSFGEIYMGIGPSLTEVLVPLSPLSSLHLFNCYAFFSL